MVSPGLEVLLATLESGKPEAYALLDNQPCWTILDESGHCLEVSEGFCNLTGFPATDWLGQSLLWNVQPYQKPFVENFLWQTLQQGQTWVGEWLYQRADGSPLWLKSQIIPVILPSASAKNKAQPTTYLLHLAQDITDAKQALSALNAINNHLVSGLEERNRELEALNHQLAQELIERKRLESQLIQAQKLEAVGLLSAGVAHEMNNPLAFVSSNLEHLTDATQWLLTVAQTASQSSDPALVALFVGKQWPYLQKEVPTLLGDMEDGVRRVVDIVQTLRGFVRLEKGGQERVCLNDCVTQTLKLMSGTLKKRCSLLETHLASDLPKIYGQKGAINQILLNLLVNAAQAMPKPGLLTLRTSVKPYQKSPYVVVAVEDSGTGIAPEIMQRLFDPFFTTKPKDEGTGLGLSISLDLAHQHGGRLEVSSQLGQGSTFELWLPAAPPEGPAPKTPLKAQATA